MLDRIQQRIFEVSLPRQLRINKNQAIIVKEPRDFNIIYVENRTAIVERFENETKTIVDRNEVETRLSLKDKLQSLVKRKGITISLLNQDQENMLNLRTKDCILPTTFDVLIEIVTRFEPKELILIYHSKILSQVDIIDWKEKTSKHKEFKFIDFKIKEDDLYDHTGKILKEISRSTDVKLIILFTPLEITNLIFRLRSEKFRMITGGTWIVDKRIYPEADRPPKMAKFEYFKYRVVLNSASMPYGGSICDLATKMARKVIEEKLLADEIRMIRLWQLQTWRTVYKVSYLNQQYQLSSQSIFGKNQKISVVSRLDEPFLMENYIPCEHFQCQKHIMSCRLPFHNKTTHIREWRSSKCSGYVVDLLYELSVEMYTEFELYVAFDGEFGRCVNRSTNEWTGMIGDVLRREADLAIQGITITEERLKVVDFTLPYLQSRIEILTLKEMPKEQLFSMYFLELYDLEARYILVPLFYYPSYQYMYLKT
ncbi:uncharacterized protein [Clytia hemisphaerica]|uniref:Ionotropic glutamate receptor L-glutamate and glycine-binding domain-containing protein n=1 Tax=Clytia hemisphaerica TaxID=252671 RepID=A0A7M5VCC6_9CNID